MFTMHDPLLTDEDLKQCWSKHMTCMVHGKIGAGQTAGEEREKAWHGITSTFKFPSPSPPVVTCIKGTSGLSPNQDNFSVSFLTNGWTLICCSDGHGLYGQLVATRVVQSVPYFMAQQFAVGVEEDGIPDALAAAFQHAQEDLEAHSAKFGWDCEASGTTLVAALHNGYKVYTANCGDSRCIIGLEQSGELVFATQDHKPDLLSEQARIDAAGGEVRSEVFSDGWIVHRVFKRGQEFPGLCKSRTLGDTLAKECGVSAVPEISVTEVKSSQKPFMIVASDGVWEFLDSEFIVKAVSKVLPVDGPTRALHKLQREAKKRWKQEVGSPSDDITAVLVRL
mmetsp:Transcript_61192/g.143166  ORF Transcript_61192/g.143166 Transcript_61192/m.143166 type:complete len:337 (+) Transcript_61192:67-1077(+)